MKKEEIEAWINNQTNLDKVVNQVFDKQFKHAIFMAGIPGSGKTEFVSGLKRNFTQDIIIEHDQLVEFLPNYQPKKYYNYRSAGSKIVNAAFKKCLECRHSFIFDGTLAHNAGLSNILKTLKRGYHVQVIYIVLDPEKAWAMTQKRELVTNRGINKDGFTETCKSINSRLLNIFDKCIDHDKFEFIYVEKSYNQRTEDMLLKNYLVSWDSNQKSQIRQRLEENYTF